MSPSETRQSTDVDLTDCDREPIQFLGRVQGFGCLIAIGPDWTITRASENVAPVFGRPAAELIGQRLDRVLPDAAITYLRSRFQVLAGQAGIARIFAYDLFRDGRLHDIAIHSAGAELVFEVLARHGAVQPDRDETALVQSLIARVHQQSSLEKMCEAAARALQALSGMDRVMAYRFDADGSGVVIAEALGRPAESYLGLRYPASDIPRQARELYKRNVIRVIGDVTGETYPILGNGPAGEGPIDLSMSVLRAVSPVHLEYLRNMGVGASMSVSILRRGELWGLFACHNSSPILLDYERRSAIELFAQLFNYELAQIESGQELEARDQSRALHDRLSARFATASTVVDIFQHVATEIGAVIPFDGIAIYADGDYRAQGAAPTQDEFAGLAGYLTSVHGTEVFAVEALDTVYPPATAFADRAVGMLAIPISRWPRDYLVLFRREAADTVTWAGNPQKVVEDTPEGQRISPRKSFAAWQETVRGRSAPWTERERRTAQVLRVTLLEAVLKLADEAVALRKRAEEQQDIVIAELNHRVRDILNLIRGLISQSKGGAQTVEDYSNVLDLRITSLARAHEQLARKEWTWLTLRDLLQVELEAFSQGGANRVILRGDEISLSPGAYTTLALLMHELITNAVKYGALSRETGEITVETRLLPEGQAEILWTERGGPPVTPPARKGFGTAIVQHSVPYELNGTAEVRFPPEGLEGRFVLPARHVTPVPASDAPAPAAPQPETTEDLPLAGTVLVVEDNLIIAMDAVDMLSDLGAAQVRTARTVAEAMAHLQQETFTFALLDVKLGDEASLEVAMACQARGITTVLATGYFEHGGLDPAFPPGLVVLSKPYGIGNLRRAIQEARSAG